MASRTSGKGIAADQRMVPLCGEVFFARRGRCADCDIPAGSICSCLDEYDLDRLADMSEAVTYCKGERVFTEQEPAHFLYIVRSGALKLVRALSNRRVQVTGFLFAGDFLGLSQFGSDQAEPGPVYAFSAVALGPVQLCRLPLRIFEHLVQEKPILEHWLLTTASQKLNQSEKMLLLLGRKNAAERISTFILQLADVQRRGISEEDLGANGSAVDLPMTRHDIADYLGMTPETVSRTLKRFQNEGLIQQPNTHRIQLLDKQALAAIADGYGER